MASWSAGYVLDIQYTSGFYRELSPTFLRFVAHANSLQAPNIGSEVGSGGAYCELACGQGFGTALLAAANPRAKFWGFDFNPAQIANARRLAENAGLKNVTFDDFSFEQAVGLAEDALPKFDIIALHGIYSWINVENRRLIVDFIDRRLKPGGFVYVSYNCMPGWAQMGPLQRLFREHAGRHPDRSDFQAEAALNFANKLREGGGLYFKQNPAVGVRMDKMPEQNRNYLAHEYLNGYWHPLYHLDVVHEMEAARLTYAASATIAENLDAVSSPPGLRQLLTDTRDRAWKETLRDFAVNKQFRRDLFVRGGTPVTGAELGQILAGQRFAAMTTRSAMTFKFQTPMGEVSGQEDIYAPLADAISQRPQTVAELAKLPALAGVAPASLLQALSLLTHAGCIHPVALDPRSKEAEVGRAFNRAVAARIRAGAQLSYLAAPAAGTGVSATYAELVGILALEENAKATAQQAAKLGWSIMHQTGQRPKKDGKALNAEDEVIAELEAQLTTFFTEKLPIWKQLGVV
jgi:SAM-dependent methyltransferase